MKSIGNTQEKELKVTNIMSPKWWNLHEFLPQK